MKAQITMKTTPRDRERKPAQALRSNKMPLGDRREPLYCSWSKEFLEAGKNGLASDTARQAIAPEVKELRSKALALKEVVAELLLENRLLKKMHRRG